MISRWLPFALSLSKGVFLFLQQARLKRYKVLVVRGNSPFLPYQPPKTTFALTAI